MLNKACLNLAILDVQSTDLFPSALLQLTLRMLSDGTPKTEKKTELRRHAHLGVYRR